MIFLIVFSLAVLSSLSYCDIDVNIVAVHVSINNDSHVSSCGFTVFGVVKLRIHFLYRLTPVWA